jgi:hypothetical protein
MNDRDTALAEVLERITPRHPYERDWDDVLDRADRRRRPRLVAAAAIALAGAATAVLAVTTPWNGGPDIVARAEAALVTPAGTVLHVKMTDTYKDNLGRVVSIPTELWLDSRGRFHGFVTDPDAGRIEIGGTRDVRRSVQYDPRTNAIGPGLVTNMFYAFGDPVAALRTELRRGHASAAGEATVAGRKVARIRLGLVGVDCKPVVDYLFVDAKTYRPVEFRVIVFLPNRAQLVRRFSTYEQLPATAASLRLTDIRAVHPTAKVYPPSPYSGGGPPACASPPGP